jgi:hypothetical protein
MIKNAIDSNENTNGRKCRTVPVTQSRPEMPMRLLARLLRRRGAKTKMIPVAIQAMRNARRFIVTGAKRFTSTICAGP